MLRLMHIFYYSSAASTVFYAWSVWLCCLYFTSQYPASKKPESSRHTPDRRLNRQGSKKRVFPAAAAAATSRSCELRIIDSIDLTKDVAEAAQVQPSVANSVISMFDKGFTVPFIARYRKEVTGGLEPTVLHRLREKLDNCRYVVEYVNIRAWVQNADGPIVQMGSRQ